MRTSVRVLVVVITLLVLATVAVATTSANRESFTAELQTRNSKLPIELRGHKFVLHTYLSPNAKLSENPTIIYFSGASGWHAFDDHIAGTMAAHGAAVYGLSLHSYLTTFYDSQHPLTVETLGKDFSLLVREVRRVSGLDETSRIILAGWSLGAGYAVIAAANPQIEQDVKGVVCVAITRENESFYSLMDALKSKFGMKTRGPFLDAGLALNQSRSTPVAILQAEGDDSASPKEAQMLVEAANTKASGATHISIIKGASNHRFDGARKEFDLMLAEALDWIVGITDRREPL